MVCLAAALTVAGRRPGPVAAMRGNRGRVGINSYVTSHPLPVLVCGVGWPSACWGTRMGVVLGPGPGSALVVLTQMLLHVWKALADSHTRGAGPAELLLLNRLQSAGRPLLLLFVLCATPHCKVGFLLVCRRVCVCACCCVAVCGILLTVLSLRFWVGCGGKRSKCAQPGHINACRCSPATEG